MKCITVLFSIALCLAVIAPTYAKPSASADHNDHKEHENHNRHRPKRQYPAHHGYPSQPWYGPYENRREDRDILPHIYRLLEELSDFVRRPPPPPPQPIYIPYPIQYQVPQTCRCGGAGSNDPNVTIRWPDMEDKRQNWGYDDSGEREENFAVNARPINFGKIPTPTSTARAPPSVEHGSTQAAQSPRENLSRRLKRCDSAVLSCCNPKETTAQRHKCFTTLDCADYFGNQDVCSSEHIQEVLDLFTAAYSPKRF